MAAQAAFHCAIPGATPAAQADHAEQTNTEKCCRKRKKQVTATVNTPDFEYIMINSTIVRAY